MEIVQSDGGRVEFDLELVQVAGMDPERVRSRALELARGIVGESVETREYLSRPGVRERIVQDRIRLEAGELPLDPVGPGDFLDASEREDRGERAFPMPEIWDPARE